jgi:secondary thiamine-phosphate synthase enzyme
MVINIQTNAKTEFIDITAKVQDTLIKFSAGNGLCFVFNPHTTAAITINENADPSVPVDIQKVLNKIIPWEFNYQHLEGNSPAHVKSSLVGTSELIVVKDGRLQLGTWQGVFFCEFDGPRQRKVHVHFYPG